MKFGFWKQIFLIYVYHILQNSKRLYLIATKTDGKVVGARRLTYYLWTFYAK